MNTPDTAATDEPVRRLSDDQVKEVLRLIKGSNSVELKLTVPAMAHRATVQGLPMDPVEAQPRQVYFFDTPDLRLYQAGVVVRARRIAGGKGDTVVKLRPVEPDSVPADLRKDPSFKIEVDALPGGFVCSASFKGRSTGQAIRAAVNGKMRLSKLFSKPQREFYKLHAPAGLDLDSLKPLGPTFVLKGGFDTNMGLNGKSVRAMTAEVWLYPDGSRILELSTKCLPNEALGVAAETRAYLVSKNVPTNAAQETKTLMALQFYSRALTAELSDAPAVARTKKAAAPRKRTNGAAAAAKPAAAAKTAARTTKAAPKAAAQPAAKSAAQPSRRSSAAAAKSGSGAAAKASSPARPAAKAVTKPAAKAPAKPAAEAPAKPAARSSASRSTTRATGTRQGAVRQTRRNPQSK